MKEINDVLVQSGVVKQLVTKLTSSSLSPFALPFSPPWLIGVYPRTIAAAVRSTDKGALLLGVTTVAAQDAHAVVPGAYIFVAVCVLHADRCCVCALRVTTTAMTQCVQ